MDATATQTTGGAQSTGTSSSGPSTDAGDESSSTSSDASSSGTGAACERLEDPRHFWLAPLERDLIYQYDPDTLDAVGIFRADDAGVHTVSVSRTGLVAAGQAGGGGLLLIEPEVDRCSDTNGEPGIQTSTGALPLRYLNDECVTHIPTDGEHGMQFVAWTRTDQDPATCEWEPERLWVVSFGSNFVRLVDADSGLDIDSTELSDLVGTVESLTVDGGGHLWVVDTNTDGRAIVRVDSRTMETTRFGPWPGVLLPRFPVVDDAGYLWFSNLFDGFFRFDPSTGELEQLGDRQLGQGLAAHAGKSGLLWAGANGGSGVSRTAPYDLVESPGLTAGDNLVGIDFEDRLWVAVRSSGLRRVDLGDTSMIQTGASPGTTPTPLGDLTGYQIANAGER